MKKYEQTCMIGQIKLNNPTSGNSFGIQLEALVFDLDISADILI